jgi:hypothetical protein
MVVPRVDEVNGTQVQNHAGTRRPGGTPPPGYGPDLSFIQRLLTPGAGRQSIFEPAEVAALARYASENGIDTADGLLLRLSRSLREYDADTASLTKIDLEGQTEVVRNAEVILRDYARLTKLAGGVNGRTLLAGRRQWKHTWQFMLTSSAIFVLSIVALAYGAWLADETTADESLLPPFVRYAIPYFTPFLWGALGSCVYILKRISDEVAANRFDCDKFQGWITRALLGALLGGTITYIIDYIIDRDAFETVNLSVTAVAFLAGLGTKVVYGGLERMISLLAEKMNLDAIAKERPKGDPVAEFVAKEIARTNPEEDPHTYQVLVKLLNSRGQRGAQS